MLEWPVRALLLVGLVVAPYLAVARMTGSLRLLRFFVTRVPVGGRLAAMGTAVWLAGIVAVPLVGAPSTGSGGGFQLYVIGTVAYGGGILALTYAIGETPTYLAMARAEDPDEVSEADGPVVMRGVATSTGETTIGPITGVDCLICETRTEGRIRRFKRQNEFWAPCDAATDAVPFSVTGSSGSVFVDPRAARVRLAEESDTALKEVADGGEPHANTAPERVRRVERRLDPGDDVIVTGTIRTTPEGPVLDAASSAALVTEPDAGVIEAVERVVRLGFLLGGGLSITGVLAMAVGVGLG